MTASYGPEAAQRAADQLGGEGRVAPLDPALAQECGKREVGVGVLLADGDQHVVRREPGAGSTSGSPRNSLTSFFGAVASQASVITSASSSRVISPSRDCCTSTAL